MLGNTLLASNQYNKKFIEFCIYSFDITKSNTDIDTQTDTLTNTHTDTRTNTQTDTRTNTQTTHGQTHRHTYNMFIEVLFNEVSYENVCDYYNSHKPDEWNPLSRLDRAEGGFSIDIQNYQPDPHDVFSRDPNAKIKQVRWQRKKLLKPAGWVGFSCKETQLLYESLCYVHGQDQVILHEF